MASLDLSKGTSFHAGMPRQGTDTNRVFVHSAEDEASSNGMPGNPASHSWQHARSLTWPTFWYDRVSIPAFAPHSMSSLNPSTPTKNRWPFLWGTPSRHASARLLQNSPRMACSSFGQSLYFLLGNAKPKKCVNSVLYLTFSDGLRKSPPPDSNEVWH